jgi:hypothetical protein
MAWLCAPVTSDSVMLSEARGDASACPMIRLPRAEQALHNPKRVLCRHHSSERFGDMAFAPNPLLWWVVALEECYRSWRILD